MLLMLLGFLSCFDGVSFLLSLKLTVEKPFAPPLYSRHVRDGKGRRGVKGGGVLERGRRVVCCGMERIFIMVGKVCGSVGVGVKKHLIHIR